jgi:hypothetical protein
MAARPVSINTQTTNQPDQMASRYVSHVSGDGYARRRRGAEAGPQRIRKTCRRRSRPRRERAPSAHGRLRREHGHVLAKVEPRSQLSTAACRAHLLGGAPARIHSASVTSPASVLAVLSRSNSDPRPKKVEIARVRMAFEKTGAVAARAGPAIGEPIEAAQVDRFRAPRALRSLEQKRVRHGQHREHKQVGDRPPRRDASAHERLPQEHGTGGGEDQSRVGVQVMSAIGTADPRRQSDSRRS